MLSILPNSGEPRSFSAYNPLYSLAGFLVGMLVGLTGVGGGSLMTPLLVLLFGFHPATAVGTDLLYASVTKSVGTAVHRQAQDGRLEDRRRPRHRQRARRRRSRSIVMSRIGQPWPRRRPASSTCSSAARCCSPASRCCSAPWIVAWPAKPRGMRESATAGRDWTILLGADPGRARVDHLGRRRGARNDRAAHPLSQAASGAHRRQRHRACGAADADRRASATG